MKLFQLLFIFTLIVSCSSIKSRSNSTNSLQKNSTDQLANVDVELTNEGSLKDSEQVSIKPNEETIRLGNKGGDVFLHNEEVSVNNYVDKSKKYKIGLSLGPGLYRTIGYVSVLKYLDKIKLSPKIITGTGFGAIVSAMYASGMTPEAIEWNFYKYFREKNKYRLYSNDWLEDVNTYLLSKIKVKNVEDTNVKFYITLFQPKTQKTYYFDKGNLKSLLLLNLKLTHHSDSTSSTSQYTTAFEKEVFNPALLKRVGADIVLGADSLGNQFEFIESNEYLIGVYSKTAGIIKKEKKGFDFFFELPLTTTSLDSIDDGPEQLLKSQNLMESLGPQVKKIIQAKFNQQSKQPE
jgi:hypothetical protein